MLKHSALFALGIALLGCKGLSKMPRPRVEDPENQAVLAKLQGYIQCLSDHSKRVFQAADAYLGPLGGKQPTLDSVVVLHATADPDKCVEAVAAAKQRLPAMPELESAGDAYAKALASVFALTTEGAKSFDAQTPHRDAAKRLALHGQLTTAFGEFERAQAQLFDQVFHINRKVHLDQLARREKKEGSNLAVRAERLMIHAEGLVQLAATAWDRLDALDLNVLATHLAEIERDLHELSAYAVAEPAELRAFIGYWSVEDQVRVFVIASKQLIKRARDRVPYSDADKLMIAAGNEASVVGSPASVIAAYNRLVEVYGHR